MLGWTGGFNSSEFCLKFGNKINTYYPCSPDCSQRLVHLNAPIYLFSFVDDKCTIKLT